MSAKFIVIALVLLFGWLSSSKTRVQKQLEIIDDVNDPDFGLPVDAADSANHNRMLDLIDESAAAIAAYDSTHPQGGS